jgi:hypothetical protein
MWSQKAKATRVRASVTLAATSVFVWCAAALSLAPFILNLPPFKELFYFGDEWDLLSQFSQVGLFRWSVMPFGQGLVPVFKLLWSGAILLFHGSYFWLLALVWLTHFAIVATFGGILRRLGFNLFVVVASMLTCGLPWSNIESLAWSVQWSPLLAVLFFMLAWRLLIDVLQDEKRGPRPVTKVALYVVTLTASALCFSRGIVSGVVLGLYVVLSRSSLLLPKEVRRAVLATSFLIPIALCSFVYATGAAAPLKPWHRHIPEVLAFGVHYMTLSPLFHIAPWVAASQTSSDVVLFGALKATVLITGLVIARPSGQQRLFLLVLLLLDLLNSCLLGIGRYDTGLPAAVSSRYQYISFVCLEPFVAIGMHRAVMRIGVISLQKIAAICILLAWSTLLANRWHGELQAWVAWRGAPARAVFNGTAPPPKGRFAYALLDYNRAAQVKMKYNLH